MPGLGQWSHGGTWDRMRDISLPHYRAPAAPWPSLPILTLPGLAGGRGAPGPFPAPLEAGVPLPSPWWAHGPNPALCCLAPAHPLPWGCSSLVPRGLGT